MWQGCAMKRIFAVLALMSLAGVSPCLPAVENATPPPAKQAVAGNFISADAVDWKAMLPPPPPVGSVAALADVETVLQVQAARTPADVAWAKLVEKDLPFADYRSVLGPWFEEKNLPGLADFLRQVTADAQAANSRMKGLYFRARPSAIEPTIQPCVNVPKSNSYPSGHTLRAFVWASVLGDIFTDRAVDLHACAHRVAWGRVIGGVHFPTDVVGGRIAAQAIVAELRKSPAYRAAIEKCQAEAAPFLQKKAA
jgi:acid phosphatase (class A)